MKFIKIFALALLVLLAGCANSTERNVVPEALVPVATIPELPNIRIWGDELPADLDQRVERLVSELKEKFGGSLAAGKMPVINILAMSAGGAQGAFGAGILNGWTATGTRPQFDIVTGVSTGALAAPFAFLGQDYDYALKAVYTTITKKDIYKTCIVCGLFGGSALAKTKPLLALLQEFVTPEVFAEIAREHRKGRRLWIGTTNLDASRPMMWDIGELANSGHPDALQLFHSIMLASSAIPGFFPPVLFDVEANGDAYDELHVDGGTTTLAFLYPPDISAQFFTDRLGFDVEINLFIILNTPMPVRYEPVEATVASIVDRSLSTVLRYKHIGDALRIYEIARRDGIEFNLAIIPPEFKKRSKKSFDQEYMNILFEFGYNLARNGYPWLPSPPGMATVKPVSLE